MHTSSKPLSQPAQLHREEVLQAERRHGAAVGRALSLASREPGLRVLKATAEARLAAARRAEENASEALGTLLRHHDALLAELQRKAVALLASAAGCPPHWGPAERAEHERKVVGPARALLPFPRELAASLGAAAENAGSAGDELLPETLLPGTLPAAGDAPGLQPLQGATGGFVAQGGAADGGGSDGPTSLELWAACRSAWVAESLTVAEPELGGSSQAGGGVGGARRLSNWILTLNELRFGAGLLGGAVGVAGGGGDAYGVPAAPRPHCLSLPSLAHRLLHDHAVAFFPASDNDAGVTVTNRGGNRGGGGGALPAFWRWNRDFPLLAFDPFGATAAAVSQCGRTRVAFRSGGGGSNDQRPSTGDERRDAWIAGPNAERRVAGAGVKRPRLAPLRVLCPFELHGHCNDHACKYQHLRDTSLGAGNGEGASAAAMTDDDDNIPGYAGTAAVEVGALTSGEQQSGGELVAIGPEDPPMSLLALPPAWGLAMRDGSSAVQYVPAAHLEPVLRETAPVERNLPQIAATRPPIKAAAVATKSSAAAAEQRNRGRPEAKKPPLNAIVATQSDSFGGSSEGGFLAFRIDVAIGGNDADDAGSSDFRNYLERNSDGEDNEEVNDSEDDSDDDDESFGGGEDDALATCAVGANQGVSDEHDGQSGPGMLVFARTGPVERPSITRHDAVGMIAVAGDDGGQEVEAPAGSRYWDSAAAGSGALKPRTQRGREQRGAAAAKRARRAEAESALAAVTTANLAEAQVAGGGGVALLVEGTRADWVEHPAWATTPVVATLCALRRELESIVPDRAALSRGDSAALAPGGGDGGDGDNATGGNGPDAAAAAAAISSAVRLLPGALSGDSSSPPLIAPASAGRRHGGGWPAPLAAAALAAVATAGTRGPDEPADQGHLSRALAGLSAPGSGAVACGPGLVLLRHRLASLRAVAAPLVAAPPVAATPAQPPMRGPDGSLTAPGLTNRSSSSSSSSNAPGRRFGPALAALAAAAGSPAVAALTVGAAYADVADRVLAARAAAASAGGAGAAAEPAGAATSGGPSPQELSGVQALVGSLLDAAAVIVQAAAAAEEVRRRASSTGGGPSPSHPSPRPHSSALAVVLLSLVRALATAGYPEVAAFVCGSLMEPDRPWRAGTALALRRTGGAVRDVPGAKSLGKAVVQRLAGLLSLRGDVTAASPDATTYLDGKALAVVGLCGARLLAGGGLPPCAAAYADDADDWELLDLAW